MKQDSLSDWDIKLTNSLPEMNIVFRWYGPDDPVSIAYIRQIPAVTGIVSSLPKIPVGAVWPVESLANLKSDIEQVGLPLQVIEHIPVHEDIKLGHPNRDRYIDNYCQSLQYMGEVGIPVLCYNFMPIFEWIRTDLTYRLPDGSLALRYEHHRLSGIDPGSESLEIPGWGASYSTSEIKKYLALYRAMDSEQLWDNLGYFLEKIVPVAESANVKLAIHADDPPWSVFEVPRIITSEQALQRVIDLVPSSANGITLYTGSLGVNPENDLPSMARKLGRQKRIHFVHLRNVKWTGEKCFYECPHPSSFGDVDMFKILQTLTEVNYQGPIRSDHGRQIWDEQGRPGYGLYDRALGAMYIAGLWESIIRK